MKKLNILFLSLLGLGLSSCMDDFDTPNVKDYTLTSTTSVGKVNSTIAKLKADYNAQFSSNNDFVQVDSDLVIEGVVAANDISGNLYQMIVLRDIYDPSVVQGDHYPLSAYISDNDQSIALGIKNTALYSYFPLGQRVRVNLKGLYVGCYSKVPKIGQPYRTSAGNWRLGPILLQLCKTNVELVGTPDASAPELVPVDLTGTDGDAWLRASANRNYYNTPMLATVEGTIREAQPDKINTPDKGTQGSYDGVEETLPKVFGPQVLHDAGYGIDRTIDLLSNNSNVTVRTSTRNEISFLPLPTDTRKYSGLLTYYNSWQIQLRDAKDIFPAITDDDPNTTLGKFNAEKEQTTATN